MHNLCRMLYQQALWTLQEVALTSCGPKGFGLHPALLSWDSFFFPSWDEMVLASWPWVINRDTHWVWASGYSQPQPLSPQVKLCRMWSWKASGRGSVFLQKPVPLMSPVSCGKAVNSGTEGSRQWPHPPGGQLISREESPTAGLRCHTPPSDLKERQREEAEQGTSWWSSG